MSRVRSALREWLELRARVHEERQFHLDQAAADLRDLGLSRREAQRIARTRFGRKRNTRSALHEIGGDGAGLAHLMCAHRVTASAWLQPAVLLASILLIFAVSPAPREVVEGMIGQTLNRADRGAVTLSSYEGITSWEFEALRSMATMTQVERFRSKDLRAQAAQGVTLAAIEAEAHSLTGDRTIYATWISDQTNVVTSPAKVMWLFIAIYGVFLLLTQMRQFATLYAVLTGCLHAVASILAWALAVQIWGVTSWLFVVYILVTGVQCRYWRRDLLKRCPICFEYLLLTLITGATDNVLLSVGVTESICAHGHGELVETRWARQFGLN